LSDFIKSEGISADAVQLTKFDSDRTSQRYKVFKGARIGFNCEFSSVECIIRNLSETGAFITVQDGILVPNHFMLFNELDGYKIECDIVWRQGNGFGVRFTSQRIPIRSTRPQVINQYYSMDRDLLDQQTITDRNPPDRPKSIQSTKLATEIRPAFGKRN
jgi:hypothetical protein